MVVPEHAKVSHADGRHKRADHLVELACSGPEYPSEGGVPHVEEGLYLVLFSYIRS